jgi:hypothetical protein
MLNGAVLLLLILLINSAQAHVCDDVLRYDPIEIRPEMRTVEIVEQGEFKIFLRNNYRTSIHEVRIIGPKNLFDISIIPTSIERVAPGQEVHFSVRIAIRKTVAPGIYPLVLKVDALEFKVPRDVQITLRVVGEKEALVKILPDDIPIAISVFPSRVEVEPNQSKEFRVYVRSAESVHNLSLFITETRFRISVTPQIIEELKPGDMVYFLVQLFAPPDLEHRDYVLTMELDADELAVRRGFTAIVRVGKVGDVSYLYSFLILFLILLLAWRWLALRRSKRHPRR